MGNTLSFQTEKALFYYTNVTPKVALPFSMAEPLEPQQLTDENILVSLTHTSLDILSVVNSVKNPKAGAVVLFAGILPPI